MNPPTRTRPLNQPLRIIQKAPADLSAEEVRAIEESLPLALEESSGAMEAIKSRQGLILYMSEGTLACLISYDFCEETLGDQPVAVTFGAQAWVHRDFRGRNLIQKGLLRVFLRCRRRFPGRPIWFFAGINNYKSYLGLRHTTNRLIPAVGRPPDDAGIALLDRLSRRFYQRPWNENGPCLHKGSTTRSFVREDREMDGATLAKKEVQDYVALNPGHADGDRLLVIVPVDLYTGFEILVNMAWRILSRSRRQRR